MVLLTTVDASLTIAGRGCYASLRKWESNLRIRKKDKIQLRTLDGKVLNTLIDSIEQGTKDSGTFLAIGFPRGITKHDIPEGAEVWLAEQ